MKQDTVYVTLRINYSYDENKTNEEDARANAVDLAFYPNYHTTQCGTSLDEVEICDD